MKYKKNISGHRWTESRRLTTELLKKFEKDAAANGHDVWKSMADPNGEYRSIKNRMAEHNNKVRDAWAGNSYNKRERVLEAFADYKSNTLTVKHVDSEHAVKENAFTNKESTYSHLFHEDNEVRIFGNSELPVNTFDIFRFGANYIEFCDYIDAIVNSLS